MQAKPTCLAILLVILFVYGRGQSSIIYQRAYGAPGYSEFHAMKITYDGGFILGSSSNANKGINKSGNNRDASGNTNDYWIIKTDSLGNKQWDKTLGGNDDDLLTCILPTSDHGYLVGGYSYSGVSYDKTGVNRGKQFFKTSDFWIIKLDSLGNTEWDKTIGGDEFDYLTSMEDDGNGNYLLGGLSGSSKSGEKSANNKGWNNDYWVVKVDAAGNKIWDKTIGGNDDDYLQEIKKTKDGGFILCGSSQSYMSGDKSEDRRSSLYDCWFVKLDASGNKQWDKTIGGTGDDGGESIIQTADGGYIAACYSGSSASFDKTENSKGSTDYWIVKLNSAGQKEWDKTIGGNNYDFVTNMQPTQDSGFIISGYSNSDISGDKTEASRGLDDYWIVKLGKNMQVQWDKTIGGSGGDECFAAYEYKNNTYLVAGNSYSRISGDRNKGLKGTEDCWIAFFKYSPAGASPVMPEAIIAARSTTVNRAHFTVYPVPARDIVHVQAVGKAMYNLTDLNGKLVLTTTLNGNGEILVSKLAAGMYYLRNMTTNETKQIMIVR